MSDPYTLVALVLLVTVLVGLVRVMLLPDRADHLLVLLLLGTTSVAVILLLAEGMGRPGLRDLALVVSVLAAIVAVAFVRYGDDGDSGGDAS